MIPDWMKKEDEYEPENSGNRFILKTIQEIGKAMGKIKLQRGHEKGRTLPVPLKIFLLLFLILLLSLSRNALILLMVTAGFLLYLCSWPAKDILGVISSAALAAFLTLLLCLPAMILRPGGIGNNLRLVYKVWLSVAMVNVFAHTTQWNHLTGALRQMHLPGVFIFILDITLKYIVLLGNLINDLLTSLMLRSVGKNQKKYQSIGGIMGVTFLRGAEMNQQMYEAMVCRGFTDDYEGL